MVLLSVALKNTIPTTTKKNELPANTYFFVGSRPLFRPFPKPSPIKQIRLFRGSSETFAPKECDNSEQDFVHVPFQHTETPSKLVQQEMCQIRTFKIKCTISAKLHIGSLSGRGLEGALAFSFPSRQGFGTWRFFSLPHEIGCDVREARCPS